MNIPTTCKVLGRTISVSWQNDLHASEDAYGKANYDTGIITLQPDMVGHPVCRELMEHTYLHELTHMILWALGRKDLSDDERFVDLLSGLYHQALTSEDLPP